MRTAMPAFAPTICRTVTVPLLDRCVGPVTCIYPEGQRRYYAPGWRLFINDIYKDKPQSFKLPLEKYPIVSP